MLHVSPVSFAEPHSRRADAARCAIALLWCSTLACVPATARHPTRFTPPGPAPDSPALQRQLDLPQLDFELLANALFHETNRVRQHHKLPPCKWNPDLQRAADLQAGASALRRTADHAHLLPAVATPYDRVRHVGLHPRAVGENAALLPIVAIPPAHGLSFSRRDDRIVYLDGWTGEPAPFHTYASFAASALEAWLDSPPHRATLLNPDYRFVACSARVSRMISGAEMLACIQVFFSPD